MTVQSPLPLVSVVVPTYNRAPFLIRAINSILAQTVTDYEIIVVDDGSTDNTEEELQRYMALEPRLERVLVYIKQVNQGANPARNAGIRVARGEYIAFLDSDDLWHPRKLELQLEQIQRTEAGDMRNRPVFSFTGRFRVDENYHVIAEQFAGSMKDPTVKLKRSNSVGTLSSLMVTAWVAREVGGFDESLHACQDWDFYLRLVPYCNVAGVRDPLVMYYDGNITRISGNPRKRIIAHFAMYKRHLRSSLSRSDLEEFYRNLAEDLEGMGHHRLGRRFFYQHAYMRDGLKGLIKATAMFASNRTIREERYRRYGVARRARERKKQQKHNEMLEGYTPLVSFGLPPLKLATTVPLRPSGAQELLPSPLAAAAGASTGAAEKP